MDTRHLCAFKYIICVCHGDKMKMIVEGQLPL